MNNVKFKINYFELRNLIRIKKKKIEKKLYDIIKWNINLMNQSV